MQIWSYEIISNYLFQIYNEEKSCTSNVSCNNFNVTIWLVDAGVFEDNKIINSKDDHHG